MIRGRIIRDMEMDQVRRMIGEYGRFSRTRIAHELCKLWDWRQSNGQYKKRACQFILNELERIERIELPPTRKYSSRGSLREEVCGKETNLSTYEVVSGDVQKQFPLSIKVVEGVEESRLWRALIDRHHYLKYSPLVGASLRQLVYNREGKLLALLGWQSAVLHLACRDRVMGLSKSTRLDYLERVANNTRFLILPWIRIPNVASAILAKSIQSIRKEWPARYGVGLWLLESFIDSERFDGACYRAANWQKIGTTKGYAKRRGTFVYHGKSKEVYAYVIKSDLRCDILKNPEEQRLTREFLLSITSEINQSKRKRKTRMKNHQNWEPKAPPECMLTDEDIERLVDEFQLFHSSFEPAFQRVEQVSLSQMYLQGLMSQVPRKNVEAIALSLGSPQDVRGLQRFMSQYKWDEDVLRQIYWQECARTLAAPDAVLSVDASETEKKGKESVGVAPQYCGNKGKRANCQSGVYVCYATSQGHVLLHSQLYMPKRWFEDEYAERRQKCGVPKDLDFQTKPQIATQLVHAVLDSGLFPCQWITADASFGDNKKFLAELPPGLKYLADISCTRRIWLKSFPQNVAWEQDGCTVSELLQLQGSLDWKHRKVAEGEKGPVVADFARVRVFLSADRNPEEECWLFLRNDKGGEIKYALSNAPEGESLAEMVRVSTFRWPIERCFQEGKGELGMDHYEHRKWIAWHRHMLMVCLAQLFLLRIRLKFKKKAQA